MSPTIMGRGWVSLDADSVLPNRRPMNFIIWNCRGSHSPEFNINFRQLLDYHQPALVVLLETRRVNHLPLDQDFNFSNVAAMPAAGQAGGIVVLRHGHLLTVTHADLTPQEIHCFVQVLHHTAE
ncbi:uncharacterized protein LOC132032369 [Lycium ferocissimum]|uniref:uncharacterized protein LOC132032369 n=1 Tax=Lycium ferocissimum TaxID=112874 RepID=UPI0028158DAA|nr:uncharacterized protein LOC132032369 [Lycium ferocissimum]